MALLCPWACTWSWACTSVSLCLCDMLLLISRNHLVGLMPDHLSLIFISNSSPPHSFLFPLLPSSWVSGAPSASHVWESWIAAQYSNVASFTSCAIHNSQMSGIKLNCKLLDEFNKIDGVIGAKPLETIETHTHGLAQVWGSLNFCHQVRKDYLQMRQNVFYVINYITVQHDFLPIPMRPKWRAVVFPTWVLSVGAATERRYDKTEKIRF